MELLRRRITVDASLIILFIVLFVTYVQKAMSVVRSNGFVIELVNIAEASIPY